MNEINHKVRRNMKTLSFQMEQLEEKSLGRTLNVLLQQCRSSGFSNHIKNILNFNLG